MHIKSILFATALSLGIVGAVPATAQMEEYSENILGQQAYAAFCGTCHGALAVGDGPLTELMTVEVPDLTQLSANNLGVFPMLYVIHIIDGRTGLRGHGGPMPVYGQLFEDDAIEYYDYGPYGSEAIIRGRMLALALYLESIQK